LTIKKSKERKQLFVLDFSLLMPHSTWLKNALHICPNQAKESKRKNNF
jgi:hypothetical protein